MDLLQTWLIIGVPGLIVVAGAFAGRSQLRAMIGYLALAVLVVVFLTVPDSKPGDVISAASVGLLAFLLVASGRGMAADALPEHQETRAKYTHAAQD